MIVPRKVRLYMPRSCLLANKQYHLRLVRVIEAANRADKLMLIARACFSCEALFDDALRPFLGCLLATKLRYHHFYLDKYSETNLIVQSFEKACEDCSVSRKTIIEWGKLVDDDVRARNTKNLALATGDSLNTAKELANLKAHVGQLEVKLDQSVQTTAELVRLFKEQQEENRELHSLLRQQLVSASSTTHLLTCAEAAEAPEATTPPSDASDESPPPSNSTFRFLQRMKGTGDGLVKISSTENITSRNSAEFLVEVLSLKLDVVGKKVCLHFILFFFRSQLSFLYRVMCSTPSY